MKKLDEIMELMADEMADFKTSILKLQLISKQLFDLSIPISTEAMEKNLNTFLEKQEAKNQLKDDTLKSIDKKLEHAMIIPNYMLVIFGILGILMLGLLGYFGVSCKAAKEEKFGVFQIMTKSENNRYQEYFSEKPEIMNDYCEWLEEKK
ncbi:DUF6730 family protein [Gramella sp. AN32]|uniref:DUF6730 family protein n=1 Tax=Christiangramia antarctica TaxID=2058158 RepID=A0ABW5X9X5_9FLAO|nr:DUF6730 family protein [Gramella sp. AN32]MCM4154756.1 hypothetical protein [Gramella sp. AN32]